MEDEKARLQAMERFYGIYNRIRNTYGLKSHVKTDSNGCFIEVFNKNGTGVDYASRVTSEMESRAYELAADDLERYESLHPVLNKKIS